MLLSLVVPPASRPITLQEAKAHARVELDFEEDDLLIDGLINTALDFAETYTQRAIVAQTWDLMLDGFPSDCRHIEIPRPPLQAIQSITYLDAGGNEQVWSAEHYRVVAPVGPTAPQGLVLLKSGAAWPRALAEPMSVTIRFEAGYGDEDAAPQQIKTALLTHVAEMYENRESSVLTGAVLQETPFSVKQLLWPFVVGKFGL